MDRRFALCLGLLISLWNEASAVVQASDLPPRVAEILSQWEADQPLQTRAGFAVRSLQPELGTMRVAQLTRRFQWTAPAPNRLVAVPIDPTERQFLPQIEIELDAEGQLELVRCGGAERSIIDRVRAEVALVSARQNPTDNSIVQASFASDGRAASVPQWVERWVTAAKPIVAVRAQFKRTDYDDATATEQHSAGLFIYSAPYDGLYKVTPAAIPSTPSTRTGANGEPFVHVSGSPRSLLWRGPNLVNIDQAAKSYEVLTRPASPREILGAGSFDMVWQTLAAPQASVPLVTGLDPQMIRKNYQWEVRHETADRVTLQGTPVAGPDTLLYSSAEVIIERDTLRTVATRIVDAARSREVVHQFEYEVASVDSQSLGRWVPDLSRYQVVAPAALIEGVGPEDIQE